MWVVLNVVAVVGSPCVFVVVLVVVSINIDLVPLNAYLVRVFKADNFKIFFIFLIFFKFEIYNRPKQIYYTNNLITYANGL